MASVAVQAAAWTTAFAVAQMAKKGRQWHPVRKGSWASESKRAEAVERATKLVEAGQGERPVYCPFLRSLC